MASTSTPSKSQQQIRSHMGHSHGGHGHAHGDNAYLTSSNKNDAGVRITRIGLYVNLGMAIAKGIGGYYFNSKALTADAIHSLTDLVSDFMTLATVSLALRPPSEKFPSGYGKVESLGSLGVSGMLLVGGALMGCSALLELCQQFLPGVADVLEAVGLSHGHGHSHSHAPTDIHIHDGPHIHAAWLALGSILIKEWLYRATLKVAKERKSAVLASNAYHHRVDSLTAFVALLMIGGANILKNATWMDPIGGLIISLMVVQAGLGNTRSSIMELADASIDEETKGRVRRAVEKAIQDNSGARSAAAGGANSSELEGRLSQVAVRNVQGVKAGQSYLIDLELLVPGQWSVDESREVELYLRERIGARVRAVKRVRIRFVPREVEKVPFLDEFIGLDSASPRSSPEPDSEDEHQHGHEQEHGHGHIHTNGLNGDASGSEVKNRGKDKKR